MKITKEVEIEFQNIGDEYGERIWIDLILEEMKKENSISEEKFFQILKKYLYVNIFPKTH